MQSEFEACLKKRGACKTAGGQEDKLQDFNKQELVEVDYFKGKMVADQHWNPVITSYDYDSPISEAGDYGQPGIGAPPDGGPADKFMVCGPPPLGPLRSGAS